MKLTPMWMLWLACSNTSRGLDVKTSQPWQENELLVELELSPPAAVAVACTLRDDPDEVHLVEGPEVQAFHALRFAGLLARERYDCVAATTSDERRKTFSIKTDAPERDFIDLEITAGGGGSEYVLLEHFESCPAQNEQLHVLDRQGRPRWRLALPEGAPPSNEFRYHGDNRFVWGGGWEPSALGRPRQVDLFEGEVYDSAQALPNAKQIDFHHDGKQLPDGRLLTLETAEVLSATDRFEGFRVRRIDPATGTVDFDYHSQRAFDEGHLPRGGDDEPWHANWVDIVDETLYVSLCTLSQVVAIDVATGDWLWTFGQDGDFAVLDASGAPVEDGLPQCQHGLEVTPEGRLLVYDNGRARGYSRVSEYQLDPASRTATLLWTWTEDGWAEHVRGDVDYLPSGRVLVDAGHADCASNSPGDTTNLFELDPVSGQKVWELVMLDPVLTSYRADWADGCALFSNAAYCPEVRERLEQLSAVLAP